MKAVTPAGIHVLLVTVLATGAVLIPVSASAQQRFENPAVGGVAVDWCLAWGADCGKLAADRFCRDHGAPTATDFAIAEDVAGSPSSPPDSSQGGRHQL